MQLGGWKESGSGSTYIKDSVGVLGWLSWVVVVLGKEFHDKNRLSDRSNNIYIKKKREWACEWMCKWVNEWMSERVGEFVNEKVSDWVGK